MTAQTKEFDHADVKNLVGLLNTAGPIANLQVAAEIGALRDRFVVFANKHLGVPTERKLERKSGKGGRGDEQGARPTSEDPLA